ncbi:MAG: hypothetical protein CMJ83_06490 [Planctomycetes bacterium]|nr:hypothetical protein [Planctomycetota bacterium]
MGSRWWTALLSLPAASEGKEWEEVGELLAISHEAARKRWTRLKDDLALVPVWDEFVEHWHSVVADYL